MSETQELIARLWVRFQPLARERVELIAAYVHSDRRDVDRSGHAAARQAAHDLVGSLGSYGRPEGSVLAARVETLLGAAPEALGAAAAVDEARTVVAALRHEVGR